MTIQTTHTPFSSKINNTPQTLFGIKILPSGRPSKSNPLFFQPVVAEPVQARMARLRNKASAMRKLLKIPDINILVEMEKQQSTFGG